MSPYSALKLIGAALSVKVGAEEEEEGLGRDRKAVLKLLLLRERDCVLLSVQRGKDRRIVQNVTGEGRGLSCLHQVITLQEKTWEMRVYPGISWSLFQVCLPPSSAGKSPQETESQQASTPGCLPGLRKKASLEY